jgi:hypothetical protein
MITVCFIIATAMAPLMRKSAERTDIDAPPAEAAAGCELLTLLFKDKIKLSQPSAAPSGD